MSTADEQGQGGTMSVLRDTAAVFGRQVRLAARSPFWILFGMFQPVVFLAFYGPLMTRALAASDLPAREAWQVFVPGVLVQLTLFGSAFVGFAVIAEWRAGVVERMRVTPVSRYAMLLGRVLRDVLVVSVQAGLLILVAVPFGLRAAAGGVLLALGFVALMALSLTALSYGLGLSLRSEDAMAPVLNTALMPLLLLSGVFLPMSLAPGWLAALSLANPFRYVVEAIRAAFAGDIGDPAVLQGTAVLVGLALLCVGYGARTFARQS
jgi:ABC-2 type transport system permease protein